MTRVHAVSDVDVAVGCEDTGEPGNEILVMDGEKSTPFQECTNFTLPVPDNSQRALRA